MPLLRHKSSALMMRRLFIVWILFKNRPERKAVGATPQLVDGKMTPVNLRALSDKRRAAFGFRWRCCTARSLFDGIAFRFGGCRPDGPANRRWHGPMLRGRRA